jgi:hypothetical protein
MHMQISKFTILMTDLGQVRSGPYLSPFFNLFFKLENTVIFVVVRIHFFMI